MHSMFKNLCVFLLIICSNAVALSQENSIEVVGSLIEAESSQPIPYATVAFYDKNTKAEKYKLQSVLM